MGIEFQTELRRGLVEAAETMQPFPGKVDVVVGLQRGDEGKGRFVDMFAEEYRTVARVNGANNAGHTVILPDNQEFTLHTVPCGITRPNVMNVIGNGVYVDPVSLHREIIELRQKGVEVSLGNLMLSSAANLILPDHISRDEVREASKRKQGSTKVGISFAAAEKYLREGSRAEDINNKPDELREKVKEGLLSQREARELARLKPFYDIDRMAARYVEVALLVGEFVTDTLLYANGELKSGRSILAEMAQAFLLDIDHGMYPDTTSSNTTSGAVPNGLGVPPSSIGKVIGVMKSFHSQVGGDYFVTEAENNIQDRLHGDISAGDAEYGRTTGRRRALGYIDLPQLRRANMVNGTDSIALAKLDWAARYGENIPVCTEYDRKAKVLSVAVDSKRKLEQSSPRYVYLPGWRDDISDIREFEDLPSNAQNFVKFLESELDVSIEWVGVGPRRDQVIVR